MGTGRFYGRIPWCCKGSWSIRYTCMLWCLFTPREQKNTIRRLWW